MIPLNMPYFRIASIAYFEHEGVYRHALGRWGDRMSWYARMGNVNNLRSMNQSHCRSAILHLLRINVPTVRCIVKNE